MTHPFLWQGRVLVLVGSVFAPFASRSGRLCARNFKPGSFWLNLCDGGHARRSDVLVGPVPENAFSALRAATRQTAKVLLGRWWTVARLHLYSTPFSQHLARSMRLDAIETPIQSASSSRPPSWMCLSCTEQCTNGAGSPWYEDVHIKQASNRHERGSKLNKLEQDGNHEPECSHVILRWTGHNQILVRLSAFFCLCCDAQHFSLQTLLRNSLVKHSSPPLIYTLLYNTLPQLVCTTLLNNTLLQHFSKTQFPNSSLQHSSLLQHFSTTLFPNSSLQHSSPTLLHNTLPQLVSTTLFSNTSPVQHFSGTLFSSTSLQLLVALLYNTSLQLYCEKLFSAPYL